MAGAHMGCTLPTITVHLDVMRDLTRSERINLAFDLMDRTIMVERVSHEMPVELLGQWQDFHEAYAQWEAQKRKEKGK